ncbi:MAG: anhydro-N-acetylmuramic acid kinase, partial [Alphaproteobacteria bacterium]|nr:anhydro-N-acetylmuramic acid kinase [Alphaproteobacteria bacterium]
PYFAQPAPKSLDRDQFAYVNVDELETEDALATLSAFTVKSIALGIESCPCPPKAVYVGGGGRLNNYLMSSLKRQLGVDIYKVEEVGLDGDALEAQAFAFLAQRHVLDLPISFPDTTGVSQNETGGKLVRH